MKLTSAPNKIVTGNWLDEALETGQERPVGALVDDPRLRGPFDTVLVAVGVKVILTPPCIFH